MAASAVASDIAFVGPRIREMRKARDVETKSMGFSRATLSRIENNRKPVGIWTLEHLSESLGIGMGRLFWTDSRWIGALAVEDEFVAETIPYLKDLDAEKRAFILKTLEAAPKQPSGRTGRLI